MKRIFTIGLFAIGAMTISQSSKAQFAHASFRVESPATISGYKMIDAAVATGTSPWGRGVDSTWENFPVAYSSTNLDGSTSFPAGYFTGKFAVIYRGGVEFGVKALNAQTAGARGVIIVNNLYGVAGMGAGAQGINVHIPTIMITKKDGDALKAAIDAGSNPLVSLTQWRFSDDSISVGIGNDGPVLPLAKVIPAPYLTPVGIGNATDSFRLFAGARMYNYSKVGFDTLFVGGVLSQAPWGSTAFTPLDSNKINFVFAAPGVASTDSAITEKIDTIAGARVGFPLDGFTKGNYKMDLTVAAKPFVESAIGSTDNMFSYTFQVHDSIYAKSDYDFTTNQPLANSYVNPSTTVTTEWGPLFYIPSAGQAADKVSVRIMRDVIDDSTYAGMDVTVRIYQFTDIDGNGRISNTTELNELGNGTVSLTSSDIIPIEGKTYNIKLNDISIPNKQIPLLANTKYWVVLTMPVQTKQYAIGTDYYTNYSANLNLGLGDGNTLHSDTSFFAGGFANAGSPAIALHTTKLKPTGIASTPKLDATVTVYPNPAKDNANVKVELAENAKSITYQIIDITGNIIGSVNRANVTNDIFTFNTNKLANGTYSLNVTTEKGTKQVKFVVAH